MESLVAPTHIGSCLGGEIDLAHLEVRAGSWLQAGEDGAVVAKAWTGPQRIDRRGCPHSACDTVVHENVELTELAFGESTEQSTAAAHGTVGEGEQTCRSTNG